MEPNVHILDAEQHDFFLRQKSRDPVTQESFKAGDHIVICAERTCQAVYHESSWEFSQGCVDRNHRGTMTEIPAPRNIRIYRFRPEIVFFRTARASFTLGEAITLAWQAKNAQAITIGGQVVTGRNSLIVSPNRTTRYVLTATNSKGSSTSELTVRLKKPVIEIFEADSNFVSEDQPITISYRVLGAESVQVNQGIGLLPNSIHGTFTVQPEGDVTYVLSARNQEGVVNASLDVEILPVIISSFRVNKQLTVPGEPILISWEVEGATKLELNHGIGDVTKWNNIEFSPGIDDLELILTAYGAMGKTVQTEAIPVQVAAIESFELERNTSRSPVSYQLKWKSRYLTDLHVDQGIGEVTGHSSVKIPPSNQDISYTLSGTTENGLKTSQTLDLHAAVIKRFRPQTMHVYDGMKLALSWQSQNALQVVLNPGRKDVSDRTSTSIIARARENTLTLTAYGEINEVSQTILLDVAVPPKIERLNVPNVRIDLGIPVASAKGNAFQVLDAYFQAKNSLAYQSSQAPSIPDRGLRNLFSKIRNHWFSTEGTMVKDSEDESAEHTTGLVQQLRKSFQDLREHFQQKQTS